MEEISGLAIHVRGIVQGVGFRPFVYQLAVKNNLNGWVRNTSNGVDIEIVGNRESLDNFANELKSSPPPLARIDEIRISKMLVDSVYTQFNIIESKSNPSQFIPISPDISICPDCLKELFDPSNRRYRYPFINCTNCGPRFSIVKDIPYDRPLTTMSEFPMCPDCHGEYQNPMDRRFHAQPTACPDCGPSLLFSQSCEISVTKEDALQSARLAIQSGRILAVKGLGGFHLACDAGNIKSVNGLRNRKKRVEKPFALMAFSIETIRKYCFINDEEQTLLESRQRPIVLLDKLPDCTLPEGLAPGQSTLGFMLPYTPLHYLLLEPAENFPEVLVMTSGNLSEEPIAYEDDDANIRLSSLADAFLTHNRGIHMRVDDSVMRVVVHSPIFTRRSRGFAPDPLILPFPVSPIFAAGAELKNHFTLTRDSYAFYSHFIGDLENYETLQSYEQAITHFEHLFRIQPEVLVCDLHPDYLSTRYIQTRSQQENLPVIQVQHHHAHLAACLVENDWPSDEPAIGLTFDGTGYGVDGTIWGGEVLIGGYTGFTRRFYLQNFRLPGGDIAVRNPARTALAVLESAQLPWDEDIPSVQYFHQEEKNIIRSQLIHEINSPVTSSMGRLFDAVSSLIGIRHSVTYEGQAAIEMEALSEKTETGFYEFEINAGVINYQSLISAILSDYRAHISSAIISARFHNSVTNLCLEVCHRIRNESDISTVALSGGVWQNAFLLSKTVQLLEAKKFKVLIHHKVPTNDACISLGQAAIAARMKH
jgi:hydrogenase maturation protein HypF